MSTTRRFPGWLALPLLALLATPAAASFHLMQIEQSIGGWCGDVSQQAVQLRMRSAGQNLVSGRQLKVHNASGGGAITLITFPSNVSTSSLGSRILIASSAFSSAHGITSDFTLTNLIPASYLKAGRLTFEDGAGNVLWSLAWGGANYTGSNTGTLDNDADGNFGPAFGGFQIWSTSQALRFTGTASAMSTNNAADYALTASSAVFTNNAGTSEILLSCLFGDGFETGDTSGWSGVVP